MHRKLKILHITGSMSIGGAERLLLGLVQHTDKSAFEVHVYTFGKLKVESFLPDFRAIDEIILNIAPKKSFYDPRDIIKLLRYIKRNQIDLVQTHMIDADIIGRLVSCLSGVPVISTLQNEPREYDDKRFDRRLLARWTATRLSTHSVAVSRHVRNLFIHDWGIPANKISTIYNAVQLDEYLSIPEGTPGLRDGVTITNVASLSPQKAQHILLEAAKVVLDRYPNTLFMIVGQGKLETHLKKQAHKLAISDKVNFTGVRRDIPNILSHSDIFTLSSFWEGLPLSAIEAMAAARPVVLTDVGGNAELLDSGNQGLIVPVNDVDALANAYLTLIKNKDLRLKMARAARERVRQQFNINTIVKQYQSIYSDIYHSYHHNRNKND